MFCGKCGCQNSENARFCRKCGKSIRQGTPAVSYCTPHKVYVPALEKAKSESRKKTWLIVGSALLYAGLYLLPVVVTVAIKVNSKNSGKRQSFS